MKLLPKLVLPVGLALSLGACADFAPTQPEYERLAQLHAGLTHDEVRTIAGKPGNVTGDTTPDGSGMWIYDYRDEWGNRSEFDVTFNSSGVVDNTYTEERF